MQMILHPGVTSPAGYVECLGGWQRAAVEALRCAVLEAAPQLDERLKWGHLVYQHKGPVLLIRAEPARLLFGFWRGQRLRHIEPRLKPGGKYEMATMQLHEDTPLPRVIVLQLAAQALVLNDQLGDPTDDARPS